MGEHWLCVHSYFSNRTQHVLFVLIGWFLRWEVHGQMLYSHLHIYMFMQHHNDTIIKTHEGTKQVDFFNNIFTSRFISRVWKGCSRFACERVLEIKHKLHILTSTTYDRHVVSFLFSWCSTGGLGLTLLDAGFLYGILSASSLDP